MSFNSMLVTKNKYFTYLLTYLLTYILTYLLTYFYESFDTATFNKLFVLIAVQISS